MNFPKNFMWGTATASYQIEGASNEDGRGLTIWDAFSHTPGKIINDDNGDVAVNHYHLFEKDIQLIKNMNVKYYRFSIAWSRILPNGKNSINQKGIDFYNKIIDLLIKENIQPLVTLYHWDLPLSLQIEHDGWVDQTGTVVDAFVNYSNICFNEFGDRVKYWLTFNEPWCVCLLGYGNGEHAPGRCKKPNVEPYLAGHSILIAHAKTVNLYRNNYQEIQSGKIGITLNCDWREPKACNNQDLFKKNQEAAERSLLFNLGWFADPIYFGDYPKIMRDTCGCRLPTFSDEEKKILQGSSDYFGLNHYSTMLTMTRDDKYDSLSFWDDENVELSSDVEWKKTDMGWNVVPWGLRKLLCWINKRYNPNGGIIITENGCANKEESEESGKNDTFRVEFLHGYITEVCKAINEGVPVKGYFVWSLLDNFEWAFGYGKRFGLHWINYETLQRVPKLSSKWFSNLTKSNQIPNIPTK